VLLGVVFKSTGSAPLASIPLKGDYSMNDIARSARYLGVPYRRPSDFPIATQHAARGYFWLADSDPQLARNFAHACYRAYFIHDRNISQPDALHDLAASLGVDPAKFAMAVNDPASKARLKVEVDRAIARGVFGSPYFIVDGEAFWGVDRLQQLEKWLAEGGF
jgi:2-hydroxychromene-2-carboxylate isomerase